MSAIINISARPAGKLVNEYTGRWTVLGDSIAYGLYISNPALRATSLFISKLGGTERNLAQPSATIQHAAPIMPLGAIDIWARRHQLWYWDNAADSALLIWAGNNDAGCSGKYSTYTAANFESYYTDLINAAILDRGVPRGKIFMAAPSFVGDGALSFYHNALGGSMPARAAFDAINAACHNVAAQNNIHILDPLPAMAAYATPTALLGTDELHPNDAGDAFIADEFYRQFSLLN